LVSSTSKAVVDDIDHLSKTVVVRQQSVNNCILSSGVGYRPLVYLWQGTINQRTEKEMNVRENEDFKPVIIYQPGRYVVFRDKTVLGN